MSTAGPAPLAWFKSSYSGNEGDECLEAAATAPDTIHIRDSKARARPTRFLRHGVGGLRGIRDPRLTTAETWRCASRI
jgi:hypothetical protein